MRFRLRVTTRVTSRRRAKSNTRVGASREPVSLTARAPPAADEPPGVEGGASATKPDFSRTKRGRAMEARLHTAVSSGAVYSTISVHRLEHLIVPKFCWLDLALHASLYIMYGLPVSTWASRMANQRACALMTFLARPSASYRLYRASKSGPHTSARPGASAGQNRDQSPPASTRRMNSSFTHSP